MRLQPTPAERTIAHLLRIDLFDHCPPAELAEVAGVFAQSTAPPGQSLTVQDTPVHQWQLLVAGHAVVVRDGTPLGLVGHGESWSEHSILNQQRSPIGVVALSPVTVLSLDVEQLPELAVSHAALYERIVARSASSADRLALPVYRALVHMERAAARGEGLRAPEAWR
jgi:CRP-like cAMP-binding protein